MDLRLRGELAGLGSGWIIVDRINGVPEFTVHLLRRRSGGAGFGHFTRQVQVLEDLLDDCGILDQRNQSHPSETLRTLENIQPEAAPHQIGPSHVS